MFESLYIYTHTHIIIYNIVTYNYILASLFTVFFKMRQTSLMLFYWLPKITKFFSIETSSTLRRYIQCLMRLWS